MADFDIIRFELDPILHHDFKVLCAEADIPMSVMLRGLIQRLIDGDLIMLDRVKADADQERE